MRPAQRDISLADVLSVWSQLGATDVATRQAVLRVLGFSRAGGEAAAQSDLPKAPSPEEQARPDLAQLVAAVQQPSSPRTEEPRRQRLSLASEPEPEAEPEWLHRLLGPPESTVPPSGPKASLFTEGWVRGLLTTMLASSADSRDIDVDAMAGRAAAAVPISLIYERVTTLRYGVQVLVDIGSGMLPFIDDCESLIDTLSRIFPADLMNIQPFSGDPRQALRRGTARRWPPPNGAVLAITDLGLVRQGLWPDDAPGAKRWERLARELAEQHSRLCVLTPYPEEHWPTGLRKMASLVYWDRTTTAAMVSRTVRSHPLWRGSR